MDTDKTGTGYKINILGVVMLKDLPELIKKIYVTSLFLTAISLIAGIIFKRSELYLGFFTGCVISMVNVYLTIRGAYKAVYHRNKSRLGSMIEYLKRIVIYCAGMYLVIFISKRYFNSRITGNIIATGLGFLNFKISILLSAFLTKKR